MTELTGDVKRELLARLLRKRAAASTDSGPELRRVSREGDLALSSGQEQWWFQEQLLPESVFNVLVLFGASGPVDREALRRSIATVVERHEILRTVYLAEEGRPVQRVTPFQGWSLPLVDLSHHGPEVQWDAVTRRCDALVKAPFDLESGPVFRTELLRLADDEYLLVSAVHHIASDGWSIKVYLDELAACYAAFSTGGVPQLPELPIQYADFAQWQRAANSGPALESQREYWLPRMAGQLPVVEPLPDHSRPTERTFAGRALHITIESALLARLRDLSRSEGVTLFTTLLTAFEAVLIRHTGEEDLLVGTFVAGRERPEVERLIGFFVNTLPLRTDLSGNPTFLEALARTRDTVLGAQSHADFPFAKLAEELQPNRDLNNPVVRVFFNKISIGREMEVPAAGIRLRLIPSYLVHAAGYTLTLFVSEGREHVDLWFSYGTELYEAETIGRIRDHLLAVLGSVVADPGQRLWDVPLLLPAEEARLRRLSAGPSQPGEPVPFHRRFEAQAMASPDAVALSSGEDRCTYSQLNARANRIARRLRQLGVGPGVLVGISLGRSSDLVAGLIGVQKTGGAYLPLDPDLPAERLAFMLADSGAGVLVSGGGASDRIDAPVQRLDLARPQSLADLADTNLETAADPNDPAYVMYTSGSTGRPKGVIIPHRALANFLDGMLLSPGLTRADVLAAVTTVSFDISALELYLPLVVGARIELVSRDEAIDGVALSSRLAASGATVLQATPGTWRLLIEAGWRGGPGFRALCGGEALPRELADELLDRTTEVWNLYGPTETTIWSTVGRVEAGMDPVHVGRPIANTRVYIVDRNGRLAPTGAPGEVWIGGDGVAAGYHNRSDLTAERFVLDPRGGTPAARLYRTGDRGRWRHDGSLELLGRIDSQVKLRGFRIELGEIEAVLEEHPGVSASAAAVRDALPGGPGLVAYVVPRTTGASILEEVRAHLRRRLPDYMVPGRIVLLERLPLTHSGKLDRLALPAPDAGDLDDSDKYAPPRGPSEKAVGLIWREILGVERVGRLDNFFELGGHSLLAMRVITRLRDIFGGEISIRRMFEMQTIAEIAAHLDQRAMAEPRLEMSIPRTDVPVAPADLAESVELLAHLRAVDVRLVVDGDRLRCSAPRGVLTPELQRRLAAKKTGLLALVRAESGGRLVGPLSFGQERLWFLDQLLPDLAAYSMTGALRLEGRLDSAALDRAIAEIVRRHASLRTTFTVVDDLPVQIVHAVVPSTLSLVDLSAVPQGEREHKAREIIRDASRQRFDVTRGPLMRVRLVRLATNEHILHVSTHHIVSDGWSMGVFVAELSALYAAYSTGRASPLPELTTQYLDFARWQRENLAGETLNRQLAYWVRQLGGDLAVLELPLDRPRASEQSFVGAYEMFGIPKVLVDGARALGRQEQSTFFMVLLGALQILLHRYSGQTDIAVGTPIANRTRLDLEQLIGLFANTLVLRTDLSGTPSFREVLARVRGVALDAYANQDIPFARVVEELQPVRDPSIPALFQVVFALQNVPSNTLSLPGLKLSGMDGDRDTAKTNLTIEVVEGSEGVMAALEYCSDLFDSATIRRLWGHFEALLAALIEAPDRPVAELPLLSPEEERQICVDWNATGVEHDRSLCLHQLLEGSARRTPDATAVVAGETSLNYRGLEQRANQLARLLRRRGVEPGSLVAVCLDRTADLPVSLLAVLKAGAAYVPLDPTHPAERLRWMIEDAGVACVITHSRFIPLLAGASAPRLAIDETEAEIGAESAEPPSIATGPDDLAYLVYTSGSTGRPKGVEVEHRNVVSFLAAMRQEPGLTDRDTLLAITTPAFDISGLELWLPLSVGARVVIASRADVLDPEALITLLQRHRVTAMQATPATWRLLLDGGWEGTPGLKALCGGEALPPDLAVALGGRVGELWNMYGPTETTIWSTAGRIAGTPGPISIGQPISNTRVYVLEPSMRPAPIGGVGELCIGGEGVARGYHNRPELTAEQFRLVDLPGRPAERLYRTGDLARRRADGSLEYLGRRDQQVKLRGHRIELGEIEAALRMVPGVTDCAVVLQETASGRPELVAYAAPEGGLDSEAARASLRSRLPEYMVPSGFVTIPALPLTANGKIDRTALRPPVEAAKLAEEVEEVLMTSTQRRVAARWMEVLERARIGLHDNFFDVGGHSLLAVKLHSKLKREFGTDFPLIELFQHSTVATQAGRLMGEFDSGSALGVERLAR